MTAVSTAPARTIVVSLAVANHYGSGSTTGAVADATIPAPPDDPGQLEDWAAVHLFGFTGSGRSGPAWYEVTVTASSDPGLAGRRFEFG